MLKLLVLFLFVAFLNVASKQVKVFGVYLQNLKRLSADCDFRAISVIVHEEKAITDAFIEA